MITFSIIGFWLWTRNWIANNVIGCILVLVILKVFRLNRLTPGLLILSVLFFYDIFWVFLSPYVFKGESVMIVVATNIDIPAKLVFPNWDVFTN